MSSWDHNQTTKQRILNLRILPNYNGLFHFVAFFHVASLLSTGIDNEKAGQQNIFLIFQPDFNIEISPQNAKKTSCCIVA